MYAIRTICPPDKFYNIYQETHPILLTTIYNSPLFGNMLVYTCDDSSSLLPLSLKTHPSHQTWWPLASLIFITVGERLLRKGKEIRICYRLNKSFDRNRRNYIWKRMKQRGVETEMITINKTLCKKSQKWHKNAPPRFHRLWDWNRAKSGRVLLRLLLFSIVISDTIKNC